MLDTPTGPTADWLLSSAEPRGVPAGLRIERAAVLVVGAGVAGLSAALELAELLPSSSDVAPGDGCVGGGRPGADVVVLVDEVPGQGGSSPWAQGGMAAAVGPDDRPADHAADTVAAGAGLVDEAVARLVVEAGPEVVAWLSRAGVCFDRRDDGSLALGREAAHQRQRIVHARDATGAELVRALGTAAGRTPGVRVASGHVAVDLLRRGDRVVGVLSRARAYRGAVPGTGPSELVAWLAPAVVLATGGYAYLWAQTTTPPQAVGDGVAMAARAGAALADLEFVQFHPTALAAGSVAGPGVAPLLTEALRGEGAVLVDETGRRFTFDAHPAGELAPRDVVARAIYAHQQAGHQVFLDARTAVGAGFPERFPTVFGHCQRVGIDPRHQLVPVSPAAHYCMGGVLTDACGRTTLAGLWAAGEVTATGFHGANRLASNSLLEGVVMGRRVAADIALEAADAAGAAGAAGVAGAAAAGWAGGEADEVEVPVDATQREEADPAGSVAEVRRLLWAGAGLVRHADGLARARHEVAALASRVATSRPAGNAVLVAGLVLDAALARRESRGAHWRADYPDPDPAAAVRRVVTPAAVPTVPLTGARAVAAA